MYDQIFSYLVFKTNKRRKKYMKFIVGYPTNASPDFADVAIRYRDHISEVYFSFGDFPNGRNTVTDEGDMPFERQMRQLDALKKMSEVGLKFNLLFNGNCYGKDSHPGLSFTKLEISSTT